MGLRALFFFLAVWLTVPAPPAGAQDGAPQMTGLELSQADLVRDAAAGVWRLRPDLARTGLLPPGRPGVPVIDVTDGSPEAALLRRGPGGGLAGVIYDNRDRGHAALSPRLFPQATALIYGADLQDQGLDYGLAGEIILPGIRFGNSSTAVTRGAVRRSLPRLAMTTPEGPGRAWAQYAGNAIYVYPEHRDHDAADLFPANWPYMLVSQGSSGSDQPILRAIGLILAALPPETRAKAEAEGLVAPTVQMVFRKGQAAAVGAGAYLTGAAHPAVFAAEGMDYERMVTLAAGLRPEDLPPRVELQVLAEDFADSAGLAGQSEHLFDTPSAIARIWRGPAYTRQMTVTAAGTRDPNGRPLRFDWVVLRGDPARVRITPLDAAGLTARISLDWQETRPVGPGDPRLTDRVDIGVFADNAVQHSAPAFLSVSFPGQEARRYAPGPDGMMRLAEVDYDAIGRGVAFDPVLHWSAPWRDVYHYGADGASTGWTREVAAHGPQPAAGDYDALGRRADGRAVGYSPPGPRGPPVLGVRIGGAGE